jgi:hypothetical protein
LTKADRFLSDSTSRLMLSTSPEEAVGQSDLVVEAIVEKLKIKQNLFKTLDAVNLVNYISVILVVYQEIFGDRLLHLILCLPQIPLLCLLERLQKLLKEKIDLLVYIFLIQ